MFPGRRPIPPFCGLGGKYKGIVDALELRRTYGTMFDYILLKGIKPEKY
ncbi:hypothetical protein ACFLXT_02175 [Chloroflexota bacterium]